MKSLTIAIIAASVFCIALISWGVYAAVHTSGGGPRLIPVDKQYTDREAAGAYVTGSSTPKLTLVEYADFQCPACGFMSQILDQVVKENSDILQLQFKQFPLVDIHNKAKLAARASEAAGKQGKFWEMHQIIYANQTSWSSSLPSTFRTTLIDYAKTLQLNTDQFKKDLDDDAIDTRINQDLIDGQAVPVKGTPTLILNGKVLEEYPRTVEDFNALIRSEAAKLDAP